MSFKIIVGIPSYNEADTISNVVKDIDDSFSSLGLDIKLKIVNSDCGSSDLTVEHFSETHTKHEKVSLKTTTIGKGTNLKNIMLYALNDNADGIIFIDSDLAFVSKTWLEELTSKLLLGYDAVFTRRIPIWNYGDLTYHLTYPLILTFWKADIHQPISGEFGFSRLFIENCLNFEWDKNILGYGVDFFLSSLGTAFNWCEVILEGKKDHKLRSYNRDNAGFITINPKFTEVLYTVRKLILENDILTTSTESKAKTVNHFGTIKWSLEPAPFNDNDIEELSMSILKKYNSNKTLFKSFNKSISVCFSNVDFYGISNKVWIECLRDFIYSDKYNSNDDMFEILFLSRVVGFYYEILNYPNWYSIVERNAKDFSRLRY